MAEYIERDALMRRIKEIHCAECDSYHGVRCRACWVDDTLDYIDSETAADVAPVRHGRWVLDEYARYFRCSACGTQFDDETDTYCNIMNGFAPNYCEDCGAKMDGGAE